MSISRYERKRKKKLVQVDCGVFHLRNKSCFMEWILRDVSRVECGDMEVCGGEREQNICKSSRRSRTHDTTETSTSFDLTTILFTYYFELLSSWSLFESRISPVWRHANIQSLLDTFSKVEWAKTRPLFVVSMSRGVVKVDHNRVIESEIWDLIEWLSFYVCSMTTLVRRATFKLSTQLIWHWLAFEKCTKIEF